MIYEGCMTERAFNAMIPCINNGLLREASPLSEPEKGACLGGATVREQWLVGAVSAVGQVLSLGSNSRRCSRIA
jgi:hypothetical protein